MNILFLNPPFMDKFSRSSRSPAVTKGGTFYYPIWLAYAVGAAEKAGYNIRFYDAPATGSSLSKIVSLMDDFQPDLAVIDTSTPSIYSDAAVAGELKVKWPELFTVLVGTHPSALPVETLKINVGIDAVVVGEYDEAVCDLAGALTTENPWDSLENINGLVFRRGEQIITTTPRTHMEDLDSLPFVSSVYRKYLSIKNYFFAAAEYPMVMIMTGRGCPYRCFFCVYPQVLHGRRYRVRSPENVVDEMEYIVQNFPGVKEIGFEDDCFTANPGRVRKICSIIIERRIKIKWYCNVRGNLSYPLLKLMKDAGCRLVTVGFESGCQHILNNMEKGERIENYYAFAQNAQKAGILVHGCIMTGNPGDTPETLQKSFEFAKKINCDSMQFYPLYVYPGTRAYKWAQENLYLKTEDFSQWLTEEGLHNCILDIPGFSAEEMVELCDEYLKKYHLRPEYLFKKLLQALSNPQEGYRSMKSARVFFSKFFSRQLGKAR